MSELTPYGFAKIIEQHQVVLALQGMMTNDILSVVARNLQKKNPDDVMSKRVFSIVVEMAQNINLYSAEKSYSESDKRQVGRGTIVISETAQEHIIASGNMVETSQVASLLEKCQRINAHGPQQLRSFQMEQRRLPEDQDSVGLVEMVRKSGNPLVFEVMEVDANNTFFTLSVSVNKKAK
jgi:hypothetical protein